MDQITVPLKSRRPIAQGTMEFTLDLTGQEFPFKAGQHADFNLENPLYTDEEGNKRIFSYVTTPGSAELSIATRLTGSAFKRSLAEMPLGTPVAVYNNRGQMTLHRDATRSAVFLAGGIGITPFMSMIRYATEQQLPHKIYLFYSNKTQDSTAYFAELEELAKQNSNFTFIPTLTEAAPDGWQYETGKITADLIRKYVTDLDNANFSMAGPPAMVGAMTAVLDELDIAEEYRKSEDFSGYETIVN